MREEIRMAVINEEGQLVDFVLERTDESPYGKSYVQGYCLRTYLTACKRPLLILGARKMHI